MSRENDANSVQLWCTRLIAQGNTIYIPCIVNYRIIFHVFIADAGPKLSNNLAFDLCAKCLLHSNTDVMSPL